MAWLAGVSADDRCDGLVLKVAPKLAEDLINWVVVLKSAVPVDIFADCDFGEINWGSRRRPSSFSYLAIDV